MFQILHEACKLGVAFEMKVERDRTKVSKTGVWFTMQYLVGGKPMVANFVYEQSRSHSDMARGLEICGLVRAAWDKGHFDRP